MKRKRMPRSIRKFIRREKTRIRREVLDAKKQKELIAGLYQKVQNKPAPAVSSKQKNKNRQPEEIKIEKSPREKIGQPTKK